MVTAPSGAGQPSGPGRVTRRGGAGATISPGAGQPAPSAAAGWLDTAAAPPASACASSS